MTEDERWMDEALAVAREGMGAGEVPIGAVVVLDDEVIGRAYTQEKRQRRLIVHADLLALEEADRVLASRRRHARLYVNLEPCLMCLGAAMTAMIGTVVYGLDSPSDGGVAIAGDWDERRRRDMFPGYEMPEIRGGVRRAESIEMFKEYLALPKPEDGFRRWVRSLVENAAPA